MSSEREGDAAISRATSFASMDTPGPFEKRATRRLLRHAHEERWPEKQKEKWLTAFQLLHLRCRLDSQSLSWSLCQFLCLNASPASKVEKNLWQPTRSSRMAHYCEKNDARRSYGSSTNSTQSEDDVKRAAKYRMARPTKHCSVSAGYMCRSR